ncbi:MAG: hypothetical protein AMXMBFR36_26370 [Acidobacteriota bacterium]
MSTTLRTLAAALTTTVLLAAPAVAVKRRAFVTSVSGNGNLNSWPDAGGLFALAAGDAICRARANAAGLPFANSYRVWLSTATTDAYCHVQGQTGEKATGCSGSPLPRGPWYRVDGTTAFAADLDELTGNLHEVYTGVLQEEDGTVLTATDPSGYWTGTSASGEGVSETCSSWVVAAADVQGRTGTALSSAVRWTEAFSTACDQDRRLLCLEPGLSDPVPVVPWQPAALAFVTSMTGNGNLGQWPVAGDATGIEAGDEICCALAAIEHLPAPESFVAWLSDSQTDARDRLTLAGVPYRRLDHRVVATSKADLVDGTNLDSLHVDETGSYVDDFLVVATGTLADGTWEGSSCDDWTASPSTNVRSGYASSLNGGTWTAGVGSACITSKRLYCFSNVVTIFWDGFELTGDASRWSSASP